MKEFSNTLMVIAAGNLPSEIKFPYSEFTELNSNVDISPTCKTKTTDAGNYKLFELRTTFDELSDDTETLMNGNRPLIVLLFDHEGNYIQIGTEALPVIATINGSGFNAEVNFEAKLIKNPL